jgi:hypothetical protein
MVMYSSTAHNWLGRPSGEVCAQVQVNAEGQVFCTPDEEYRMVLITGFDATNGIGWCCAGEVEMMVISKMLKIPIFVYTATIRLNQGVRSHCDCTHVPIHAFLSLDACTCIVGLVR